MDWKRIARDRLRRAEEQVRAAEAALQPEHPKTQERYRLALRELEFSRRFLARVERDDEEVEEARGIFC